MKYAIGYAMVLHDMSYMQDAVCCVPCCASCLCSVLRCDVIHYMPKKGSIARAIICIYGPIHIPHYDIPHPIYIYIY